MSDRARRKAEVSDLRVQPDGGGGVVLVLTLDPEATIELSIGLPEATAIAQEMQGATYPRPLTHDLMRDLLDECGATVKEVAIVDLREGTYIAEITLVDAQGRERRVDARPSDSIALALRADAPVYVHEQVLRKAKLDAQEMPPPTDKERWKEVLEEMDPEDFGKYKM